MCISFFSSKTSSSSSGSASSSEESTAGSRPLILSTRKESSKGLNNKRKAIAIVRPQQHVREEASSPGKSSEQDQLDHPEGESSKKSGDEKGDPEKVSGEAPSSDREARFSLYDFQSDSETEEKLSSSNLNNPAVIAAPVAVKKNVPESAVSGNRNNNRKAFSFSSPKRPSEFDAKKPTNRTSPSKSTSSSTLSDLAENSESSAATTATTTTSTSTPSSNSTSTSVKSTTATTTTSTAAATTTATTSKTTSDGSKEFQQPTAPAQFCSPASIVNNDQTQTSSRGSEMQHLQSHPMAGSHHHADEANVGAASRDHRGDDNRSTDSGVSTIRSVSGDERSGSRSSTVSDERSLRPSPYLPDPSSTSPPNGNNSHAHPSQSGRTSGPPPVSNSSNPGVWRDPALLAIHQARSAAAAAAAAGKLPHLGQAAAAHHAASMAEHHRQPGAPGSGPNPAAAMSAAAATAAQFSAIQHYQVKPILIKLKFLIISAYLYLLLP